MSDSSLESELELGEQLVRSGLITHHNLDRITSTIAFPTQGASAKSPKPARRLAEKLRDEGLVTSHQAQAISRNRVPHPPQNLLNLKPSTPSPSRSRN